MEEILYWCRKVGCTMGETPILFENRRSGYSKIDKGEAVKALQIILQLGSAGSFTLIEAWLAHQRHELQGRARQGSCYDRPWFHPSVVANVVASNTFDLAGACVKSDFTTV